MITIAIFADFPVSALKNKFIGRKESQVATWLPQLAETWNNASGFDIHWCIPDKTVSKEYTTIQWNQTFHRIPTMGMSKNLLLARFPQRLIYRKFLKKIQPDIIHCWGTESLNSAAIDEFDGPSILSLQGIIFECMKTGGLSGWHWHFLKNWEKHAISSASTLTCESQWGINKIREKYPAVKSEQIEYGVHPSFYDVDWIPKESSPIFLYIGGLNRLKGADIMLNMLSLNRSRKWKIIFVGSGPIASELKDLKSPNTEFHEKLTSTEIQQLMKTAWALVHPSRADTSPNVVKEARVIGLPVIGSHTGGHSEYINPDIDGILVKSTDPNSWFDAIDYLASDFKRCKLMGNVNHQTYKQIFAPGKTAEQLLRLYKVMKDHPSI